MYWNYLKYVLKHKWYVFKICMRKGLFIHAFTHDFSKFWPSEFVPYAKKFYGPDNVSELEKEYINKDFRLAVLHHYNRNKHHLNYWIDSDGNPYDIPIKYVKQLVADWQAMGLAKKGDYKLAKQHAIDFFIDNREKFNLTPMTEHLIKKYFGIKEKKI